MVARIFSDEIDRISETGIDIQKEKKEGGGGRGERRAQGVVIE